MKPPILRNLTKLMLVNGLALFFGLITVSSTLATPAPTQIGQPAIDLRRSASLQVGEPNAVFPAVPAAPVERAAQSDQVSPAAGPLADTSSVTTTEVTALISGTLSQDWGDFDRDGQLDLALGTLSGISIYRNDQGQLIPSTIITSDHIYGVRWADLNNDGFLELITVRNLAGANNIYRYTGSNFISYTAFTAPFPLARVTVLNGNTRDLIASTSAISTSCSVLRYGNNGRGYFTATTPSCVSTSASAGISAGDFDNDGDSDLVLGSFPNEVKLLINQGNALTETQNSYTFDTALSWPYDFAWGDYDGDGRFDLAAAFPLQRQVRIYHNEGLSTTALFKLSSVLPAQRFMTPLSIDWGDFDGDGALDLAVADDPPHIYFNVKRSIHSKLAGWVLSDQPTNEKIWGTRAVALNNSDLSLALSGELDPARLYDTVRGHLQSEIMPLATAGAAHSVAWGDANGDGKIDLLLGTSSGTTPGTLYLNSNGTITTTGSSSLVSGRQQSVALGKFNRDKDKQLGIVIGDTDSVGRSRITVYANWLDGSPRSWFLSAPVGALALGDFNNDGWLDLLAGTKDSNGNGTLLLYRNDHGSLVSSPAFTTSVIGQVQSIAWTDYDVSTAGVSYMDFAVATSNRIYVYRNNQDNTFTSILIGDAEAFNVDSTAVAWSDFDGDSRPELAVGTNGQGVRIYRYENDSFVRQWTLLYSNHTTSLASGDWNNDGRIDLAVGNDGEPDLVYANLGLAAGLPLTPLWSSPDTGSTTAVAWGDVNNDGYLDLAVSRRTGSSGVYYNTSVLPWRLPSPPSFLSIARPGRANTAYLYSSSDFLPGYLDQVSPTLASTVTVYYTVSNPAGILITNTQLEVSLDGGSSWQAAHYTRTLVPTQTTASGRAGVLIWDAWRDQAFSDNALLRLRVVDQAPVGPFQRAASVAVSPPFRARVMTCQWLTGLWIDVKPGHNVQPLETVTFEAKVSDFSGGIISYTWNLSDGTSKEGTTVYHAYKAGGTYTVSVHAENSLCREGPALEAVTVVQVGSYTPTLSYKLYLPTIQRSSAAAQSAAVEPELEKGQRREAAAAALGGTTPCISKTIQPSSWPLVTWISGTTGYYGQPVLNHDGSRFAFWSTADLAGTNPDGNIELYYARVNRTDRCVIFTQITSSTGSILEGFNLGPAINAVGDRVAFYSDRDLLSGNNSDENFEIFLARVNSNGDISLTQVTSSSKGVNALPTLNANGDRIAFVSDQNYTGSNSDGNQEIFAAAIGASGQMLNPVQVTQTGLGTFNDEPSLSGNSQRVAFVRGGGETSGIQEIFVGNADVSNSPVLSVTASPTNVLNYRPTIGGDGSPYSVAYATTDLAQEVVKFAAINGTNVNVKPVYTTTRNSLPALNVVDGTRLVVISNTQAINVLLPGNQSIKPIYSCAGNNCPYAAISGDGMHVLFASKRTLRESYYETATLSLLLTQPAVPAIAGTRLTRTLILANSGPSLADGVEFSGTLWADAIALPVTATTSSPNGTCSGSGPIYCRIPGLSSNSSVYITLTTNQDIDADRLTPVTLAVGAHAWQASRFTITPSIAVAAEADLQVAKTVATTGVAGELVTYTLVVTNGGPSHALNVTLTDRLPDDLISPQASTLSIPTLTLTSTAGMITGTMSSLLRNASAMIQVVGHLSSTMLVGKPVSNTAVATSITFDPDSTDNRGQADFIVTTRSALTVTKSAPVSVTAGLPLTYTIIVTNNGPSATSHLVLTDSLPPSMTVSTMPAGCLSNGALTQITCNLLDLDKGNSYTLTFTADTDSEVEEQIYLINTVMVSATNAVRTVSNTATTQTAVGSYLNITKTATPAVTAGEPLTYTIFVENWGPSRARNINLIDYLPIEYVSYTAASSEWPTVCNYDSGQVVCFDWWGIGLSHTQIFYIYATTYPTLPVGTVITNTASVTATSSWVPKDSKATTRIANSISRLTVTKSADATALAGSLVHYTITVGNNGPSYARYVTVTDHLPLSVTFAPSPGCTSVGGNDVECYVSNLYVGPTNRQTVTLAGQVSYTLKSGSSLLNTAVVTANNAAASVSDTASTSVRVSSPLTIEKKATNAVTTVTDPLASPEIVTYTIVVTNIGSSLAERVVLTDVLPVSVTYLSHVSANPPVTPAIPGQTLTWSLDPVAPNSTAAITFTGRVLTSTVGPVTLTNTAYVSATAAPRVVTATGSTTVLPRVRLALTKTLLTPQPVAPGLLITYQVSVQNLGPSVVPSVTITDDLRIPFVTSIITPSLPQECGASGLIVTCTINGELAAGASHAITISASTTRGYTYTAFANTAYATSTIATAVVSDTEVGTTVPQASLRITKTLSPLNAVVVAGGVLTYVVTVGNGGPSNVSQLVTLTDILPAELLNVQPSSDCSGPVSRVVTCTVGSLNYNSTWSVTVTGRLTDNLPMGWVITNTAQATTTIASTVVTGSLTTTVGVLADLRISKLAAATARVGDPLTYTIIVTNTGPSRAYLVRITDTLPISVTYLNQLGAEPSISAPISTGRQLTWTLSSDLAPSATQIITFNVQITNTVGGSNYITNTAYVTSTSAPSVAIGSAVTLVRDQANLVLTKTLFTPSPIAGEVLTYQITVTNLGPSPIPGNSLTITDQVPSELTYNSFNLALNRPATSNQPSCQPDEGPEKAVNGSVSGGDSDKWCASDTLKWLQVDLGFTLNITQFVVSHAGAGGENSNFNTRVFNILTSTDGTNFTEVVSVTSNTNNVTTHTLAATTARFVRLNVVNGAQSGSNTARIYEFEIYGSTGRWSTSPNCSGLNALVTCTKDSPLGVYSSWGITITGKIRSDVTTAFTNTAYATATIAATGVSNLAATTVGTSADLGIATVITPTSVYSNTGGSIRVTISFTNTGPSDARSVYITGTLGVLTYTTPITKPAYVDDPTGSTCSAGSEPHQCIWFISTTLPANLTGKIEFTATAPSTGVSYSRSITVSIASALTSDSNQTNNTSLKSLLFVQLWPSIYWAGLLTTRWPVALIDTPPRNFWSFSP